MVQIFLWIFCLITVVDCQGGGGGGGGGAYGFFGVVAILICLPIYCCCAGRPRRSNAKFVNKTTSYDAEKQIIDIKLFQSGTWESQYYQYNKWHGPHQVELFFDMHQMKITGSGSDDVGLYSIDGIYSTQTRRIGLTKTYLSGSGNISQNLGHNVIIQLEWNRDNNQFEGKWLSSTDEHWFTFNKYQFSGFYTPLFTLISSLPNTTDLSIRKNLSFALSTYENSIDINNRNEQLIKLNIERADLMYNTINHLIFIAIRKQTKFETYVNCKLIDSYLLNATNLTFTVENLTEGIKYYHEQIFEKFGCKQTESLNETVVIERPLIRKMQHIIEKVQHLQSPLVSIADSLTIIYKPHISQFNNTILNVSQLAFHIRYYPKEHLFHLQFNNENRTQFILYAGKSTDTSTPNNTILFLHITSTMITCYVNCELTDQEFIIDSSYVQNIIRLIMNGNNEQKLLMQYDRQSTLILFNKSIDQVAANFFCLKLDKDNEDLLPDKYTLRKFANTLDVLVDNLDIPITVNDQTLIPVAQNISPVDIHLINGFGSLQVSSLNIDINTIPTEIAKYNKSCLMDEDCSLNNSFLTCQNEHCMCSTHYFWSSALHRCISCKDLSIGNRCFRLSNHKSTWYETNDYCQDENSLDEQQEYTMKLTSNLTRTDIELLTHSLLQEDNGEQLDYFYWIGLTNHFNIQKFHKQNYRTKRRISTTTTIFHWYDNNEITQLDSPDIWCSQKENINRETIDNNELCVSLTSCGLYADDCQRNYRYLCEAA
ncbi:unnamed protein product [Adineta steineri]|uniref:C-type lectin domain-containing protein n=1 Tax=Adineta steineri TaxID=433720 RepID=A0A819CCX3_9BILA|nr:unnamed protein product [Adineta steineri]